MVRGRREKSLISQSRRNNSLLWFVEQISNPYTLVPYLVPYQVPVRFRRKIIATVPVIVTSGRYSNSTDRLPPPKILIINYW